MLVCGKRRHVSGKDKLVDLRLVCNRRRHGRRRSGGESPGVLAGDDEKGLKSIQSIGVEGQCVQSGAQSGQTVPWALLVRLGGGVVLLGLWGLGCVFFGGAGGRFFGFKNPEPQAGLWFALPHLTWNSDRGTIVEGCPGFRVPCSFHGKDGFGVFGSSPKGLGLGSEPSQA